MNHALFTYSNKRADLNVFETAIKSLRSVSDCQIYIFTDDLPVDYRAKMSCEYDVTFRNVDKMDGERAYQKVRQFCSYCYELIEGDHVGVFDADLFFVSDPFKAFDEYNMQPGTVGLTQRGYDYWCQINGGVFYFNINNNVKKFLRYHQEQCYLPTWDIYNSYRERFDHIKHGRDWTVGQDFLNVCWGNKDEVEKDFGIQITGISNDYNFCPAVDVLGVELAKAKVIENYVMRKASILHLKSELKGLIYDGILDGAVTKHDRGNTRWN